MSLYNKDTLLNHPKWETIKNQSKSDVVFVSLAYWLSKQPSNIEKLESKFQEVAKFLPSSYQIFLTTDYFDNKLNSYAYSCIVLVDHQSKDIVFANAGTRFNNLKTTVNDLADDSFLVFDQLPRKSTPAFQLNDIILENLGAEAKNFKFHYTGHSLGASLAEIAAADMDIKLRQKNLKLIDDPKQISATTFDNPGTKNIIEKLYHKSHFTPPQNHKDLTCVEILNTPNVINTLHSQQGDSLLIKESQISNSDKIIKKIKKHTSHLLNSDTVDRIINISQAILDIPNLATKHSLKYFYDNLIPTKNTNETIAPTNSNPSTKLYKPDTQDIRALMSDQDNLEFNNIAAILKKNITNLSHTQQNITPVPHSKTHNQHTGRGI